MSSKAREEPKGASTARTPLAPARPLGPITRFALPPEVRSPTPEVLAFVREIAEETRAFAREALIEASEAGEPAAAFETIGAWVAAGYEARLRRERAIDPAFARRAGQIECRRGCTYCCHVQVVATPLEAARLAAAIGAGERRDLEAAVLASAEALAGLDAEARLGRKAACPLLQLGACSLYEARPLACRALVSVSVRDCERHFAAGGGIAASLPSLVTPRLVASGFLSGEIAALGDLGLAGHLVELTAALAVLLRDPAALSRWLGGADVFPRL